MYSQTKNWKSYRKLSKRKQFAERKRSVRPLTPCHHLFQCCVVWTQIFGNVNIVIHVYIYIRKTWDTYYNVINIYFLCATNGKLNNYNIIKQKSFIYFPHCRLFIFSWKMFSVCVRFQTTNQIINLEMRIYYMCVVNVTQGKCNNQCQALFTPLRFAPIFINNIQQSFQSCHSHTLGLCYTYGAI